MIKNKDASKRFEKETKIKDVEGEGLLINLTMKTGLIKKIIEYKGYNII